MIFKKQPLAVCEFTQSALRVLVPRSRALTQSVEILGNAEVTPSGYENGIFFNLSDAAESLRSAVKSAAKSAEASVTHVTMSIDDPHLENLHLIGSSVTDQNIQTFEPAHLEEARKRVLQSLPPSDRHPVYQEIAGFIIDGSDIVCDPVGTYGKDLKASLHLLLSKSEFIQDLRSIAARAGLTVQEVFPSALAALHGIAGEHPEDEKTLVLAETHICHLLHWRYGAVQKYSSILIRHGYDRAALEAIYEGISSFDRNQTGKLLATGEAVEEDGLLESLAARTCEGVERCEARLSTEAFRLPRYSTLAGLIHLGIVRHERKRKWHQWAGRVGQAKGRIGAFVDEYF